MLNILKRAAGFGKPDLIPDEEFASAMDAFPIPPEPTILDRAASAVTKIVFEARADIAKLSAEIADREERRRQAQVIVDTFEPTIQKLDDGYDASDDGAKCFDLSVETKRKRGDKHWPKRASELAAAE
ncbi:MAG: hypothetical protein WA973_06380 [Mesorhizobium sp.]